MELFPFSADEWLLVSEAARAVVNATLAEDEVLRASLVEELYRVLADLRSKYGEHPVLLETEADFNQNVEMRIALYEKAKQAAGTNGLPTYSVRIALARVLLQELAQASRALSELRSCKNELSVWADDAERRDWSDLQEECVRQSSRSGERVPLPG